VNDEEDLPPTHDKQVNKLGENLQSLQITDDKQEEMADSTPTQTDTTNYGKFMVPEPGFFNGTRSKFEDWWRQMKLYMRFNKIVSADDKAMAVLA
jgi:hypothetical protein